MSPTLRGGWWRSVVTKLTSQSNLATPLGQVSPTAWMKIDILIDEFVTSSNIFLQTGNNW